MSPPFSMSVCWRIIWQKEMEINGKNSGPLSPLQGKLTTLTDCNYRPVEIIDNPWKQAQLGVPHSEIQVEAK